MRVVQLAGSLALLATLALGQEARERLLGSVAGKDGNPWENATVVLHSEPAFDLPELGAPDTIEVRTSGRGRFRADVLPGRTYRAWAIQAEGAGARRQTAVVGELVAGRLAQLVETDDVALDVHIRFHGLASWQPVGKTVCSVFDEIGRRQELVVDDQGEASLPLVAGLRPLVEVHCGDSLVLRRRLAIGDADLTRTFEALQNRSAPAAPPLASLPDLAAEPPASKDRLPILVPPPMRAAIQVLDAASRQPIAGARITRDGDARELQRPAAVTDAEGRAVLALPTPCDGLGRPQPDTQILLHAVAPGYRLYQGGWSRNEQMKLTPLTEEAIRAGEAPPLTMELEPGFTLRGRVLDNGPVSAAQLAVLCRLPGFRQPEKDGSYFPFTLLELVRTDATGNLAIPGVGQRSYQLDLALALPRDQVRRLAGDRPADLPCTSLVRIPVAGNLHDVKGDLAAGPVDLGKLRVTDLDLKLPDGRPAAFASVDVDLATQSGWNPQSDDLAGTVQADRRGRCRIVTVTDRPLLMVRTEDYYLLQRLDFAEVKDGVASLCVIPFATVEGRVVDTDGRPVPGADVQIRSSSWSNGSEFTNLIGGLNQRALRGKSDQEGRFCLRFIPDRGLSFGIGAMVRIDGNYVMSVTELHVGQESTKDAEIMVPAQVKRTPDPAQGAGK